MILDVGDIVVVRDNSWAGFMIRLGAALRNKPNLGNHVAIMHHYTDGVPWGIEGRPGGVGWVDMRKYLSSKWTVSNSAQPINVGQANLIAKTCEVAIGTPYDWEAIAADIFEILHIRDLFVENWKGQGVPGHVVCSSLAAWAYGNCGVAHPDVGNERLVSPGDWSEFIIEKGWE